MAGKPQTHNNSGSYGKSGKNTYTNNQKIRIVKSISGGKK